MKIFVRVILLMLVLPLMFSCSNDVSDMNGDASDTPEEDIEDAMPTDEEMDGDSTVSSPNILLIIADDMGLDASPGYTLGSTKPNMPNLEQMINTGLTFTNAWAYPTCTPTRASILTGKYGFRTNVLKVDDPLATSETSLQQYIDNNSNAGYSNAVIGKWHLSRDPDHPSAMGIGYYAGLLSGAVQDYRNWNLQEDGSTSISTEYTTTKFTDLAIDWIAQRDTPWFLWLAYNAPHTPFHLPPAELHSQGALPEDEASINANPLPYYMAAMEAMDTEVGRLLDSMSPAERENTLIVFVGDNGTPNQVRQEYPNRRVKGTVYQGGINIPMIVSGATVDRMNETENALVHVTDLFATIADVSGAGIVEINDSKSIKGLFGSTDSGIRDFAYTEIGNEMGGMDITIRNATHKYILFSNGSEALYQLSNDPLEDINLLNTNRLPLSDADSIQRDALLEELNSIRN